MDDMFYGITLSVGNYDSILAGWSGQSLQNNVPFNAVDSCYFLLGVLYLEGI